MVSKYQNLGKSWKCKRIIVVFMVWGHLGDSCPTRVDWCVLFLKKIFLLNSRVSFAPDAKQSTSFMSLKWLTTDVLRSSLWSPDQMNPLIVNIFGGSQSTRSCLPGVILTHSRHFFSGRPWPSRSCPSCWSSTTASSSNLVGNLSCRTSGPSMSSFRLEQPLCFEVLA